MFYLFLGAWVLGLDLLLGSPYSLDQLFSYKVEPLSRHFLMGCIHFSGAGWEPCRGKTPHSWIHLQLSHLLPRPLVHCAEDKAMSRLFLHGLITAHRSENYQFFPLGSSSSPARLPLVEHSIARNSHLVSHRYLNFVIFN